MDGAIAVLNNIFEINYVCAASPISAMKSHMTPTTTPEKIPWTTYALYLVPFLMGLAVCTVLTVYVYRGFVELGASFSRVVVPGKATITLAQPGSYTVFHERKSIMGNEIYTSSPEAISGIRCIVKEAASGEEITLTPSSTNATYSLGSREGVSIFDFSIARGGAYEFACAFPDGARRGLKTVFAVGQGFMSDLFSSIFAIFGIVAIFVISASVSAALIIIKVYNKSQRAQNQPA